MFIRLLLEYVRYNFKSTKEQFPDINDKTLKSAIVYRYVHFYYLERDISIYEILEIEGSDSLGLIGPGSGRLTRLLEFMFGWSDVFSNHAILHDAFVGFTLDSMTAMVTHIALIGMCLISSKKVRYLVI